MGGEQQHNRHAHARLPRNRLCSRQRLQRVGWGRRGQGAWREGRRELACCDSASHQPPLFPPVPHAFSKYVGCCLSQWLSSARHCCQLPPSLSYPHWTAASRHPPMHCPPCWPAPQPAMHLPAPLQQTQGTAAGLREGSEAAEQQPGSQLPQGACKRGQRWRAHGIRSACALVKGLHSAAQHSTEEPQWLIIWLGAELAQHSAAQHNTAQHSTAQRSAAPSLVLFLESARAVSAAAAARLPSCCASPDRPSDSRNSAACVGKKKRLTNRSQISQSADSTRRMTARSCCLHLTRGQQAGGNAQ